MGVAKLVENWLGLERSTEHEFGRRIGLAGERAEKEKEDDSRCRVFESEGDITAIGAPSRTRPRGQQRTPMRARSTESGHGVAGEQREWERKTVTALLL